jgi:hypothetical protein
MPGILSKFAALQHLLALEPLTRHVSGWRDSASIPGRRCVSCPWSNSLVWDGSHLIARQACYTATGCSAFRATCLCANTWVHTDLELGPCPEHLAKARGTFLLPIAMLEVPMPALISTLYTLDAHCSTQCAHAQHEVPGNYTASTRVPLHPDYR